MSTRLDEAHAAAARGLATDEQLARIVAEHLGWRGVTGGWIVNADGQGVGKGWGAVARQLTRRRWIARDARGRWAIDWTRLPRVDARPDPAVCSSQTERAAPRTSDKDTR